MQFVEAHGARIPIVGFGSMRLKEEAGAKSIEAAIRNGYRHIDTAAFYGNEREVGQAIRASGVPRDEIFLTTKVRDNNLKADDFARSRVAACHGGARLRSPCSGRGTGAPRSGW